MSHPVSLKSTFSRLADDALVTGGIAERSLGTVCLAVEAFVAIQLLWHFFRILLVCYELPNNYFKVTLLRKYQGVTIKASTYCSQCY